MNRDEAYQDTVICPRCGRRVEQGRVARYEHRDCSPRQIDPKRQREAIRRAYEAGATYLVREGHPEEADRLFKSIAELVKR